MALRVNNIFCLFTHLYLVDIIILSLCQPVDVSMQVIWTEAEMLNKQLCIGLWWPVVITSQKKAVLGLFCSKCFNYLSLRLPSVAWMVQGSKERGGQSDDLALQLHLQLGMVAAGVRN